MTLQEKPVFVLTTTIQQFVMMQPLTLASHRDILRTQSDVIIIMELFRKNSQWLLAVNYFYRKCSSRF